jgi:hypothetical protein
MMIYERALTYASSHVIFSNSAHAAGGFGLALLLQHYLRGDAFLPPIVGWLLVAFSAVFHAMAFLNL